jgi:uncharacterized membrane protein YfcA
VSPLSLLFGILIGLSLGLTGGGGALFAVPLLVYGLAVEPREAVGASLVTVAGTAALGFVQRARGGTVEFPTGLLFAVAGMITAPFGAWLSSQIPEPLLLVLFGLLMLGIAARMWLLAVPAEPGPAAVATSNRDGTACHRNPHGQLTLTSRCAALLATIGLATGVLTGLFGVSGGFLIVPALVTFSGMELRRAIGTSLFIITLVSLSGIASHFVTGGSIPWQITTLFLAGGLAGMWAGTALADLLDGRRLQQVFATALVAVGIFVITRNVWR